MKYYQALADAFFKEQPDHCFALLGDANMHFAGALADQGVSFIYSRHEHAAVAAATSYARATGRVGVATVTCGPGLTQLMTILPIASRARIPLVIFAGEAPLLKEWYNQKIDQAPFVEACGAIYHALHDKDQMIAGVHQAFATAKKQRNVVVVGVPFDLQQMAYDDKEGTALPLSDALITADTPVTPDPQMIATAAQWLAQAERPIILAGLGAVSADARAACVALANASGALLANTLPAKGYFKDEDFYLGVSGGFATEKAKDIYRQADLVIGVGARLAYHAFNGGKLTPDAKVIHLDSDPQIKVQGRKAADLQVKADALLGAQALLTALPDQLDTTPKMGWRTDDMKEMTKQALVLPDDHQTPDGLLHPMAVVKQLAEMIGSDCHIINTSGHCAYYAAHMNYHPQSHFTVIREFGAIGNGTSFALGIAAAHPERPVILIDGDGSALMHIQEWETMKRHQMKILTIVMNDGAYGSEVHKLRADGVTEQGSVFGDTDFAAIGAGFGLQAHRIQNQADLDNLTDHWNGFLAQQGPAVWDMKISDKIASPQILAAHKSN